MEWTTDKPTQSGWYWVYHSNNYSDDMTVDCVNISIEEDGIWIAPNFGGYECEADFEAKHITHYMGPLVEPEPPAVEARTAQDETTESVKRQVAALLKISVLSSAYNEVAQSLGKSQEAK